MRIVDFVHLARFLFAGKPIPDPTAERVLDKAWKATRKDTIRSRLLVVEGLPAFLPEEADAVMGCLRSAVREAAKLSLMEDAISLIPVEDGACAVIELLSPEKVGAVKHRFASSGVNIAGKDFQLKISRDFVELEEAMDPRAVAYLRNKLLMPDGAVKPAFQAALVEVYTRFASPNIGLGAKELNAIQRVCQGEDLTPEMLAKILTKFGAGRDALTLDGFIELYKQEAASPVSAWQELGRLGYDLHFCKMSFATLADSMAAMSGWCSGTDWDQEIVSFLDDAYSEAQVSSPAKVPNDVVVNAPSLGQLLSRCGGAAVLAFRTELIRLLNELAEATVPLVDFSKTGPAAVGCDSIAQCLWSMRCAIWHRSKMLFMSDVMEGTGNVMQQPAVMIERIKLAERRAKQEKETGSGVELQNTIFGTAWQQLQGVPAVNLRRRRPQGGEPHFGIKIVFRGENVEGEGGPYRQFFSEISRELQGPLPTVEAFSSGLPLFVPCPNAQMKLGDNRDRCIPRSGLATPLHLDLYRFVGRLMGVAMRTGILFSLNLPAIVWRQLLGEEPRREDLRAIDESFDGHLLYIARVGKDELEGAGRKIFERFVTTLSDRTPVELVPGGASLDVTVANRDEYLRLVEATRLGETRRQIRAMRAGLCEIIPEAALRALTWRDLEWCVCGRPTIDVALLKRHTEYGTGLAETSPHVRYFWEVMEELSQQDLRQFLRFAWAQERIPADDHEFQTTGTRMMIKPFLGDLADPDRSFVKADTCFFNLLLPEYSSREVLRERLLTAIRSDSDSMDADHVHSPGDEYSRGGDDGGGSSEEEYHPSDPSAFGFV
jgi:hypothetical protein